jgi:hypothetical protein
MYNIIENKQHRVLIGFCGVGTPSFTGDEIV